MVIGSSNAAAALMDRDTDKAVDAAMDPACRAVEKLVDAADKYNETIITTGITGRHRKHRTGLQLAELTASMPAPAARLPPPRRALLTGSAGIRLVKRLRRAVSRGGPRGRSAATVHASAL
ncbi:hypothetical protein ABZ348_02500 [Streptomyces sp. NPDC005963]|uniref:hypothetical protein n=1 Tax=Streptomyces sp. NPDC005963 TaxID=3156721 RepID=UPI0033F89ABC